MTTTPSNPWDTNAVEIWEVRQWEIQWEETEAQAAISEEFKASPESTLLLEAIWDIESFENADAVYERIVSLYSKNGKNLEKALTDTFSKPNSLQLWLPEFSPDEKKQLVQYFLESIKYDEIQTSSIWWEEKTGEKKEVQWSSLQKEKEPKEEKYLKIEENPGYPMLQRFAADGKISPDEFKSITEAITPTWGNEELVSLIKTHITDSGVQAELLAIFGEKDPEVAKQNFFQDAKVPEGDGIGQQGDIITQLIGENYKKIPNAKGEVNIEADKILAIQTACNKTIDGKRFKRDETVQDALETIQAGESIPQMVKSLRILHGKVNTGEAMKDGGEPEEWEDWDKKETWEWDQEDRAGVLWEINQIIKDAQAQSDSVRVAKAEELRATLETEKKVEGGEAGMGWGELDALLQKISLPTKSA